MWQALRVLLWKMNPIVAIILAIKEAEEQTDFVDWFYLVVHALDILYEATIYKDLSCGLETQFGSSTLFSTFKYVGSNDFWCSLTTFLYKYWLNTTWKMIFEPYFRGNKRIVLTNMVTVSTERIKIIYI